MSRIAFNVKTVERVAAASDSIAVEAEMTETQMFDTVQSFLQHITDTTWADWQRRLDTEPSAHEAFTSGSSALA